jgi:hypothetical protein
MQLGLSVDILLNLVWLGLGVSGLGLLAFSEFRNAERPGRLRRVMAVLVLTLALFPMVSASDDELSFTLFNRHAGSRGGVGVPVEEKERSDQGLARVFDFIDAFQVQTIWTLLIGLSFYAFIACLAISPRERFLACRSGRGPPLRF